MASGAAKAVDPQERLRVLEASWQSGPAGLLVAFEDLLFDARLPPSSRARKSPSSCGIPQQRGA
jgi:hypothetical protein